MSLSLPRARSSPCGGAVTLSGGTAALGAIRSARAERCKQGYVWVFNVVFNYSSVLVSVVLRCLFLSKQNEFSFFALRF